MSGEEFGSVFQSNSFQMTTKKRVTSKNITLNYFTIEKPGLNPTNSFFSGIWIQFLIFYEAGTSDRNRLTE